MATRRRSSNRTITGTVSDLQRRVRYLQAITPPSRLATQVVARTNVRPRAINSDQIELAAVTNDQVAADAIKLANMDSNSVGKSQLVNGTVENRHMDDNAVAEANLQTDAVTEDKIRRDAVVTDKIENLAVTTAKLANSSVDDNKLTTNAVTEAKIRNGAVARSKIQDRAVGNGQLADSSVSTGKIGNSQVTNSKIGGTISGGKIGSGFNGGNINNGSISNGKLSGGTRASAGRGLTKSGNTLAVSFNQVARSGHRHSYSYAYYSRGPTDTFYTRSARLSRFIRVPGQTGTESSKRLKKNIQSSFLENPKKLLELDFKKFQYKRSRKNAHEESSREWMYGYLAEDLVELGFEHVVMYDKKGRPEKVDYGLFSTLVLELVKTQQKEIELLQEKIANLETK